MRPSSIANFERIVYGTLIVGLIQTALAWQTLVARAALHGTGAIYVLIIVVLGNTLWLALTIAIARQRSRIAIWLFLALIAIGIPDFVRLIFRGFLSIAGALAVVENLGEFVACALLFTSASRHWLREKGVDPDVKQTLF